MNMTNPSLRRTTALVFILVAGAALTAQESGTLRGVVRDAAGRPIQGVLVTITSPNMLGVRNVQTNERGEYSAPLLPVGNYRVSVSRQGYLGQRAENVRLGLGATQAQNFTMVVVAEAGDTVEISTGGDLGQIDKTETGAKTNVSAETLAMLPVSRTFGGAVQLTPGVVAGASGQLNIRGGQSQQTQYRLNGADVKDDYQGVLIGYGAVADAIEDVQVVLSETHARFGRSLGGSINVITKSGSNSFSGSFRTEFDRGTWTGNNTYTSRAGTNSYSDDLWRQFSYTFNGPVLKDRVWFAFSGVFSPTSSATYGIAPSLYPLFQAVMLYAPITGAGTVLPDPDHPVNQILLTGPNIMNIPGNWGVRNPYDGTFLDAGKQYVRTDNIGRHEFKLTAMPIQNHTIEIGYVNETQTLKNRNAYGDAAASSNVVRLTQIDDQKSVRQVYNYGYKGIIGDAIFIEARYSKTDSVVKWPAMGMDVSEYSEIVFVLGNEGAHLPLASGIQSPQPFGRGLGFFDSDRSNRSGNLNIKWIADFFNVNHEIDGGVDYFRGKIWEPSADATGLRIQVGGMYANYDSNLRGRENFLFPTVNYQNVPGSGIGVNGQINSGTYGTSSVYFELLGVEGLNFTDSWSYYLNDKFIINEHWNGMFGLRYENTSMTNARGVEYAKNTFLSPRLQLTYDWKGDSSHLFTLSLARYGTDYNNRLADTLSEKGGDRAIRWGWTANPYNVGDPSDILNGVPMYGVRFIDYAQLIDKSNYTAVVNFVDTSYGRVVENLENPYMDEYTIGYKRQLRNGTSVGLTYVNRAWRNDWAAKSEYLPEYWVVIPDPTNTGLPNQYQQQTRWFSAGDDLKRDYQALELDFTARLNSYWTVGGNWTISRLTGNDEGGDNTGSFADYSSKAYYNNRTLLAERGIGTDIVSPYGRLINDQTNRGRFYAIVQMPLGQGHISFSPMLYYNSALPGNVTITNSYSPLVPTLPRPDGSAGNVTAFGNTYTQYLNGRGWRQGNDHFYVDFAISFAVPLGIKFSHLSRLQMMGDITVTNLFNARIYNDGFYNSYYTSDIDGFYRYDNRPGYTFGTVNLPNANYWRSPRFISASLGLRF